MMAIGAISEQLGIDDDLKQQILALPGLFGGPEVFDKAMALTDKKACIDAVENLKSVYALLSQYGMDKYISLDFGLLHDIAYYSGIIFRGITPGIGFPVVSGGRYDELLGKFGDNKPATGFALGLKRVMIAMERQGLLDGYYQTDAVISCDMAACAKAYDYAEQLRQHGKRSVFSAGMSQDALIQLKADNNAAVAVYFDANGSMEEL